MSGEESPRRIRPDPKLLSLLDKMTQPLSNLSINLELQGVFGTPEEWLTYDEQFKGLTFAYIVNFLGFEFVEGKPTARKLTEKELKEQEEALAAKKKKPVTDKKKDKEEVPQLSPEELAAQQKLEEEKKAAELRAQEEWNSLSEEEKYYRTWEDPYKRASIRWESSVQNIVKTGDQLVDVEDKIAEKGGDYIYFIKRPHPSISEDELKKIGKAKPKGLNLGDLNHMVSKAWVDLSVFHTPGVTEGLFRCKLQQELPPEANPADHPSPNLENAFVTIRIKTDPAITPLVDQIRPKPIEVIPKNQSQIMGKLPATTELVSEFKGHLALAMEAIAGEYANIWGKENNSQLDQKNRLLMSQAQKREIREKKKEQFLEKFHNERKYELVREKLRKSVVKLVRDKFQKSDTLNDINTETKNKLFSELYVYLIEQVKQTQSDLLRTRKDDFHEDLFQAHEELVKERDHVILSLQKESLAERYHRLAYEAEIINNFEEAEKNYKNLCSIDESNAQYWYIYTQYLLKRGLFSKAEETLHRALEASPENKEYQFLMTCLLVSRNRIKEAFHLLRSIIDQDPHDTLANLIVHYIYGYILKDNLKATRKSLEFCKKLTLKKLGKIPPRALERGQQELFPFRPPSVLGQDPSKKLPPLSSDELDDMWLELAEYLTKNHLYSLALRIVEPKEPIYDKSVTAVQFLLAKLENMRGGIDESIRLVDGLIEKHPQVGEFYIQKAEFCYNSNKFYESEDTYLRAFGIKSSFMNFQSLIRVGSLYLLRRAWEDAKSVFVRACGLKPNSSTAWLGLGISSLRLGHFKESEEALMQAQLYDFLNAEICGFLALLCLEDSGKLTRAIQSTKEMLKLGIKNHELLEELGDKFSAISKFELAEGCLKRIIDNWTTQNPDLIFTTNIGTIFSKLGRVYHAQEKLNDAKINYEEALKHVESEVERERIQGLLNQIGY